MGWNCLVLFYEIPTRLLALTASDTVKKNVQRVNLWIVLGKKEN